MNKIAVFIFISIIIVSCHSPETEKPSSVPYNLWSDNTTVYLPETAEWTNRVEVADLNNDGLTDIIFANGGNYSEPGEPEPCRIFLNQGADQPFLEISDEVFGDQLFYARVAKAMDLNNDGLPDLVIGNTFQTQSHLYLADSSGKYTNVTASHLPAIQASIGDLEFGDVDLDGDLDIVLADWGPGNNMSNAGGRTMLWLNDGNANFTDVTDERMPDVLIRFSWDIEFIDIDNDFDLDLAVSCKRCETSRLFENDGSGFFSDRRGLPAYTNNYDFEVMDVNNDRFMDLVTINDGDISGSNSSRKEHLFLNDSGKFFRDVTFSHWPDMSNIGEDDNNAVFFDYDSDGDADFLISSLSGEDRLLVNDGNARFTLAQPVIAGNSTPHTLSLVIADLDNDGRMDIVMGQGEGDKNIEERIFMADALQPDTGRPSISKSKFIVRPDSSKFIQVRIHDLKSPSLPHEWKEVRFFPDEDTEPVNLKWYGEYLWYAEIDRSIAIGSAKVCATDRSGNFSCRRLIF